jgi:phage baseplate assembly protein W
MSQNPYNAYSTTNPTLFGNDLALTDEGDGGDLFSDSDGDLASNEGWDNLRQAIVRRLNTMQGHLSRLVRDVESLYRVNHTYGNPAYRFLSEPINNNTINGLRTGVEECLREEDRIAILSVSVRIEVEARIRVVLDIEYTESGTASGGSTQTLSVLQTDTGFVTI